MANYEKSEDILRNRYQFTIWKPSNLCSHNICNFFMQFVKWYRLVNSYVLADFVRHYISFDQPVTTMALFPIDRTLTLIDFFSKKDKLQCRQKLNFTKLRQHIPTTQSSSLKIPKLKVLIHISIWNFPS